MVCYSCVYKLALKLIKHHKNLDVIRAFEFAEKAVERIEQNKKIVEIGKGNSSDYTQSCTWGTCRATDTCTKTGQVCVSHADCADGSCGTTGECGCPAPLPNSSQVSPCTQPCTPTGGCAFCKRIPYVGKLCMPTCGRSNCLLGTCGYDCDEGYIWNGEACALAPKIKAGLHPAKVLTILLDN